MSLCLAARVLIALDISSSFRREATAAALLFARGWSILGQREKRVTAAASSSSGHVAKSLFSVVN